MSMPDLAPGAPSRVVDIDVTVLTEDAPMSGWVRFSIAGDLRVPGSGKIIGASSRTVQLAGGKGKIRLPTVSSAVVDDAGDSWVIIVQKSWLSQPYGIRVPAGPTAINLADLPPARPLTKRETAWALTSASLAVQTLPAGQPAGGSVTLEGGTLRFDLRVPQGPQGMPGPGAVAADDAVAAYVQTTSKTRTALDTTYRRGYSPREFGVTGDGSTDDTAAWNAALASVPAGATITCPEGHRYRLTGPVVTQKAVTVEGGEWLAHTTGVMWDVRNDGVTLRDQVWTAVMKDADSSHRGIYARGTTDAPVRGLVLDRIRSSGFGYEPIRLLWCRDVTITDCNVQDFWYAGVMVLSSTHGRIERCTVRNARVSTEVRDAYGIAITDNENTEDARSRDWVVDSCRVEDIRFWEGIDTHSGQNITITNNTILNCRDGVAVLAGNSARTVAPTSCVVTGNTILGGSYGDTGIKFLGVANGSVADGVIGTNVIMGYVFDIRVAYHSNSRTVVLPQTTDATTRNSPPAVQWREWNAVSTVNIENGSGAASVTFPAGMFSVAPLVQATKQEGVGARYIPYVSEVTATGCRVALYDPTQTAQSSTPVKVAIRVTQARSTTAAGNSGA